jgi:hypothetical protein
VKDSPQVNLVRFFIDCRKQQYAAAVCSSSMQLIYISGRVQGFFDLSLPFRRERFTTGKSCQVFHRLQETAVCSSSMQQQYAANLYIRKGAGIF